jgi:hypothetical protein
VTAFAEPMPFESKAEQRRARNEQRHELESGRMTPELRYRALLSILRIETDFLDLADKKARFALIIMSALNAVALVVVVRGGAVFGAQRGWGIALSAELVLYGAATIYYIWQAIESLRPRGKVGRSPEGLPMDIVPGASMRVVFHVDIAQRERSEFRAMWDHLRLDNLNTELADQIHMVSRINVAKYDALGRLYVGVGVMTGLLTLLLLTAGAAQAFA